MKKATAILVTLVAAGTGGVYLARAAPPPQTHKPKAWAEVHRVEPTRLLRRGFLALANRAPTIAEYEALLEQPADQQRQAALEQIEALLDGPEFDDVILRWAIETLRVGSYDYGYDFVNTSFNGHYAAGYTPCPDDSLHAGAVGFLNNLPNHGQPYSMCDDPDAEINDVEPWWAPGTTVRLIGTAGQTELREVDGVDCGRRPGWYNSPGCSCGPHLLYCKRTGFEDDSNHEAPSMRRDAFEEPARLLQHIVRNDRPLSDLVVGDYTVVTRGLHFLYYRNSRRNSDNAVRDDDEWFRDYEEHQQWREIAFEDMHANLLSDRHVTFDPRVDDGEPPGLPAAGVMTMLGSNWAFPRERVRAARWLETFACRQFTPPPAEIEFHPYERDPGTEGICEHCHQLIDPAAMHFKRMYGGGAQLGGIGNWSLRDAQGDEKFRDRSLLTFEYDTLMTPVETVRLEENPDAALIDFLPDDYSLFGEQGDGTIGPLGFGKILVESGEFDRCMVRRVHRLVAGRDLVPGLDDPIISEYVEAFVADDRNLKSLIKAMVRSDEFTIGW